MTKAKRSSPPGPRRPTWRRCLAVLLASTCLVLVSAELFVRWYFDGRFDARPLFYLPDDETVFRTAPNLDDVFHGPDFGIHIHTDAFGCRLGVLGSPPSGADLVLLVGDSHTFSWGVSTADAWGSILDQRLNDATGGRTRALNLGVGGYSTLQSARRLAQFARARPDARIRCVLYTHCSNDPTDNAMLGRIGVLIGSKHPVLPAWVGERHASPSSFWNLLTRAWSVAFSPATRHSGAVVVPDEIRDAMWTFDIEDEPSGMPATFRLGAATFRTADIGPRNRDEALLYRTRALTPVQRRLMAEALDELHGALRGRGVPFYHGFLWTMPPWMRHELGELVKAAPAHGNRVIVAGRIPERLTFRGKIRNQHSGGHFNPRMNRDWANAAFELLRAREPALVER